MLDIPSVRGRSAQVRFQEVSGKAGCPTPVVWQASFYPESSRDTGSES